MIFTGTSPVWFLGFDAVLELVFLLVTALIAWYSFRVHRFSGQRRYLWWGVGFLSLSAAYAVNAFANYYLYARIIQTVSSPVPSAVDIGLTHLLGYVAYSGLFVAGYLLLALVSLRFDDTRLITLFAGLVALLSVALAIASKPFLLHLAAIILLCHVIAFLWLSRRRGEPLRAFVLSGFLLLILGHVAYLALPLWGSAYALGHFLELLGYSSLLASMVAVLRR